MDIPVYLFTGFLEAGKTRFIQETLGDPEFFQPAGRRTLVLLCEEGEEELDPAAFASEDVFLEVIENERQINPDKLEALRRKHRANLVVIEYNGMWLLPQLYQAMPEEWLIYQEIMFADAGTIEVFNANMRNLVVDKLTNSELVVFNRCNEDTDKAALHKLVRSVSRRSNILYEEVSGEYVYDDIEDPLPFDVNAPVINIEDRDYALFFRDLSDNMAQYDGKTVTFLGSVVKNARVPKDGFIIGRPIMVCCAEDIAFRGLFCESGADAVRDGEWVRLTAKISLKHSRLYGGKGPVLKAISSEHGREPDDPVATFY
ncbi:MAG: hypothetical protein IJU78_03225 [Clostridia bacterium]|nr:hypothetical protein [Clostridia bacterium]